MGKLLSLRFKEGLLYAQTGLDSECDGVPTGRLYLGPADVLTRRSSEASQERYLQTLLESRYERIIKYSKDS